MTRSGPRRDSSGSRVGTHSAIAAATTAGLSRGTHVLAPGTETSVALGNSDASRCVHP